MSTTLKASGGGIGLGTTLTVVLGVLKLAGVLPIANWSWFLIIAPMCIPLIMLLAVLCAILIVVTIIFIVGAIFDFLK